MLGFQYEHEARCMAELKELFQLVKDGKVKPIPVATRPLAEVGESVFVVEGA